jgi:suppressor for copper-sensitivity B
VGYEDGVVLPIAVRLARPGAPLHLHAEVDYASCKEVCIPYHASLDLTLPSGLAHPGPEAPLLAAARARVPGDLSAAQLKLLSAVVGAREGNAVLSVRVASTGAPLQAPDLFVEGLANGSAGHPEVTLAKVGREATIGVPIRNEAATAIAGTKLRVTLVDRARAAETEITPSLGTLSPRTGETARGAILGVALLGGLVLNLMPCVLPVLSLKLLALAGYAGGKRRAARLGLFATAAGVIVSFGLLAAVLILLKAAGAAIGWGIQFQQPWFLAVMALVTTLFAANLWGWAPVALPSGIAGAVDSIHARGRSVDAFLMGAFATLLAASCSAPFVGTAIGFALAGGPLDVALVFGALGLGMAAPFLAISAAPGLVAYLPRPGPWMLRLQRILGLALLGTAAWLLSVLAIETGVGISLLAGGMLAVLLALLAWRRRFSPDRRARRTIEAGAIVLTILVVLVPSLRGQAVPVGLVRSSDDASQWQPFDEVSLHEMVANGKTVFVDVTAAWCLTCKANELAVLDRPPVADRLGSPDVIAMQADWTRPDPAITAYLQCFGRYGVPLDVVYGAGAPQGIALPELLTANTVTDAFRRAARVDAQNQEATE